MNGDDEMKDNGLDGRDLARFMLTGERAGSVSVENGGYDSDSAFKDRWKEHIIRRWAEPFGLRILGKDTPLSKLWVNELVYGDDSSYSTQTGPDGVVVNAFPDFVYRDRSGTHVVDIHSAEDPKHLDEMDWKRYVVRVRLESTVIGIGCPRASLRLDSRIAMVRRPEGWEKMPDGEIDRILYQSFFLRNVSLYDYNKALGIGGHDVPWREKWVDDSWREKAEECLAKDKIGI